MTEPDTTSRTVLAGSAYRSGEHLVARQSLYSWQEPRYDMPGMVVDLLPETPGLVVDVGCGNGKFLARIREQRPDFIALGLDISAGILADVQSPAVVADAAALPVASGSARAVLAMHMLYHVDDLGRVLAEVVRVMAPGGVFVVSTNGRDDKAELDELWAAAAAKVLGVAEGPRRISLSSRFTLDDAPALLEPYFADVDVHELPGAITVMEPEPVIAHLASYRTWAESAGVPFDPTLDRARVLLTSMIDRDGKFTITGRGGMLVCRRPTPA